AQHTPLIRMGFNEQEFIVDKAVSKGDYWKLFGHIPPHGHYTGVDEISFCVPKGVQTVRLGLYVDYDYVLLDEASRPSETGIYAYLSDTEKVHSEIFPHPKPRDA
ncbi:MAG: hypothetical protein AAB443_03800, partial [Patescibacteria group bacterium]